MKRKTLIMILALAAALPVFWFGKAAVVADQEDSTVLEKESDNTLADEEEFLVEEEISAEEEILIDSEETAEIVTPDESEPKEDASGETKAESDGEPVKVRNGIEVRFENSLDTAITAIRICPSGDDEFGQNLLDRKVLDRAEPVATVMDSEKKAKESDLSAETELETDGETLLETESEGEDTSENEMQIETGDENESESEENADTALTLAPGQKQIIFIEKAALAENDLYDMELTFEDGSTEEVPMVLLIECLDGNLFREGDFVLLKVRDSRLEAEEVKMTEEEAMEVQEEAREALCESLEAGLE